MSLMVQPEPFIMNQKLKEAYTINTNKLKGLNMNKHLWYKSVELWLLIKRKVYIKTWGKFSY